MEGVYASSQTPSASKNANEKFMKEASERQTHRATGHPRLTISTVLDK